MSAYCILIVDDDPTPLEVVRDYMALSGYVIRTALGGVEALELMRAEPPDLVLLDVQMPGLDGFGVLQRMRQDATLRAVPVMFLSSQQASHVKIRGLELGADDFIGKDCLPAELLARVRAGLRRAARYQQLNATFSGVVGEELALDALLQTVQIGMRSARIRLLDLPAEIACRKGTICSCTFRSFEGAEALARIFVRPAGRFTVDTDGGSDERGAAIDLMGALVAVDESRAVLSAAAPLDAILAPAAAPLADAGLERRRRLFPLPILELLILLEGDVREAAARIAKALREGMLFATA